MKLLATLLILAMAWTASAATRNNDASCDIGVVPAATLLLPFFEVDLLSQQGETTVFTITNTTAEERIARVTLWTDWAVPIFTFNVRLAGYELRSMSMYDVLARGIVPEDCGAPAGPLPEETLAYLQSAFTGGVVPAMGDREACPKVGEDHDDAAGYATIDVVGNCSTNGPDVPAYWSEDLRYDNVLIGDYEQVNSDQNFAQGSPMVHIRAVPEGGTPQQRRDDPAAATPFQRTFYAIYQNPAAPLLDARQPLPSVFAARWISGGVGDFQTFLKIWRQGKTHTTTCNTHKETGNLQYVEIVKFDEMENAVSDAPLPCRLCAPCLYYPTTLPATSRTSVNDFAIYPVMGNGAVSGWLYFNLDNCQQDSWGSQNWVVVSMRAEGRYSVDMDAAPMGNGCSAPAEESEIRNGSAVIGPRP